MGAISMRDTVEGALAEMRARGFDDAQATIVARRQDGTASTPRVTSWRYFAG